MLPQVSIKTICNVCPLALPEPSRPLKRHAYCSFIATFKYSQGISSVQKHRSLWYIPNFANGFGSLINLHNIKHLMNSRTFKHHTLAYNSSIFIMYSLHFLALLPQMNWIFKYVILHCAHNAYDTHQISFTPALTGLERCWNVKYSGLLTELVLT